MTDIKKKIKEEESARDGIINISLEDLFKAGWVYYYPHVSLREILPSIKRTIPRIEKSVEEK